MKSLRLKYTDLIIIVVALLGVAAYVIGAAWMGEAGFPLDDAWIHQTYARNLVQYGEWAFVPGQVSAGSTAPLYTLLLSIGYVLRLPFMWWTSLLGAIALAVAGLLNSQMAEKLVPHSPRVGLWAGLATVTAWHLIWAAGSGMETMLFGTVTLLLVWLCWREVVDSANSIRAGLKPGLWVGLAGAAATLTRPEAAGLLGILVVLIWLDHGRRRWRRSAGWTMGVFGGWLLGSLPYALFNMATGTGILPNTASAKQAEYAFLLTQPYLERLANMASPLLAGGQVVLVPGSLILIVSVLRKRRSILLLAPLIWLVALVGLYAARLPAVYQHGRYVLPALPHLILFGAAGTDYVMQSGRGSMPGRVLSRSLGIAAVLLFVVFWLLGLRQFGYDVQIIQSEMVATSRWVSDNIPDEDLLAVHDIGALGYFAPRAVLDLAGLVSPEVIPIIRDPDALWNLMEMSEARYLMALADQIPGQNEDDARLCRVFSTQGEWSPRFGGSNMAVYRLAYEGDCPQ